MSMGLAVTLIATIGIANLVGGFFVARYLGVKFGRSGR